MSKYLFVKVDTNDADYVSELQPVTEEHLALLRPLFEAIRTFKPYTHEVKGITWTHGHNFPSGDQCRTDLGEKTVQELYGDHEEALELLLDTYAPMPEYGFHTIDTVRIFTVSELEDVL